MRAVLLTVAGLACLVGLGCEGENPKGQPQAEAIQAQATVPTLPPAAMKPEDHGPMRSDEAMIHKPAKMPPHPARVVPQAEVDAMMKRFADRAAELAPEIQADHERRGLDK
jgi:hypothetical protein